MKREPRPAAMLLGDSLREVSVLVLVFCVLDGLRGSEATVLAGAAFVSSVLLERFR